MPVVDVRVDDRLIHGQVCSYWVPYFDLNQIVIVDDDIVHDKMRKTALRFGCPDKIKLSFHSAKKVAQILATADTTGNNIMLLCNKPRPIVVMQENGFEVPQVTLGNISPVEGDQVHVGRGTTYVTHGMIEDLKQLAAHGTRILLQTIPSDAPQDLASFLAEH